MVKRINGKRQTNKTPSFSEAIMTAAAAIGRDGKGDGGVVGYFKALGMKYPKLFVGLLARVPANEPELAEKSAAAEAERVRPGSGAEKIREELLKDVTPRLWPRSLAEAVAMQQQQKDEAKNG